jgi:hypothetical protein
VSVRDELGNPVEGVEVDVTVKTGSGTLSDTTVVSDMDGLASATFTPDTDSKAKIQFDISPNNAARHRVTYELSQNPSGTLTLTHGNQLVTGLGDFDSLVLSDGKTVSKEQCSFDIDLSLACDDTNVLYSDFQIRAQSGTYRVIVGLEDSDKDGQIEENFVKVVDEGKEETIFYGELKATRATDIVSSGSVSIFDETNYNTTGTSLLGSTDPPCNGCDDISKTFKDSDILVNQMYGRVTVNPS